MVWAWVALLWIITGCFVATLFSKATGTLTPRRTVLCVLFAPAFFVLVVAGFAYALVRAIVTRDWRMKR